MDSSDSVCMRVKDGLFKCVSYYVTGNVSETIDSLLKDGGGKKHSYLSDMISHVIAGDGISDEVSVAKDLFQLPVVTSSWVLQSVQCSCLLPTAIFDPDPGLKIFLGIVVCPSQLSAVDNKVLWTLVTCYGGKHQLVLNKNVTHLVTTKLEGAKYSHLCSNLCSTIKIVTPDWIVQSVQSKMCADERQFHPRLLQSKGEKSFSERSLSGLSDSVVSLYIAPGTQQLCLPLVEADYGNTGKSESKTDSANNSRSRLSMYKFSSDNAYASTTQFVSGSSTLSADICKQPVLISSISAVNATQRVMPSVSTSGVPPRSHLKSIGNSSEVLSRNSRNSLKAAASAKVTTSSAGSTVKQPTHQQLTARHSAGGTAGYNCNLGVPAARVSSEWDLRLYYGHEPSEHIPPDVCLLGCIFYIADYPKYLEPSVLEMWKKVIGQYGGQVDDSYSNRITHVLCEHQRSDVFQLALRDGKRLVTAHWLNDCLSIQKMEVPTAALHFPFVFGKEQPCCNQLICITNFEGDERRRVKLMIAQIGAKYTGYMTRANSILIAKHLGGLKYLKAVEWSLPVVGIHWLNDVFLGDLNALKLPIQAHYQIQNCQIPETSRSVFHVDPSKVAHLLEGWKTPVKISKETWKKFQSSQVWLSRDDLPANTGRAMNENTETISTMQKQWFSGEDCSPEKKQRLSDAGINQKSLPVITLTGIHGVEAHELCKEACRLGGQVVQSVLDGCTHLVANSVLRTVKFLMAIGTVQHIVTSEWIMQSSAANQFLDEKRFALNDEKKEELFMFSLQTSLSRAREQPLFQNLTFYFTPSVQPNRTVLTEIVKACGGEVLLKLPSRKQITKLVNSKGEPTFILVSCEADMYLLHEVEAHHIGIHNAEFVLTGALRQEVDFSTYRIN